MIKYILHRVLMLIPTVIIISIISFVIIQLPPGDYMSTYIATKQASGFEVDSSEIESLRIRYGLDQPMTVQYFKWAGNILKGDFGYSFDWEKPVKDLIGERLALTVAVSLLALLFAWVVSFPIGIYSAVHQNSVGDYTFSFFGFLGLATPQFMIALILMFFAYKMGSSVGGLFSPQYIMASWDWAKFKDLMAHIWVPMVVIGASMTAGNIRVMRNNLLDELKKPYVTTARSKGLKKGWLIFKYPVRIALIPFVSTVGWQLPMIFSGATVVSQVLNLPTIGPLMLRSLLNQDMYLAGSILLLLATLTCIGTLISDILLVVVDPRIKFE